MNPVVILKIKSFVCNLHLKDYEIVDGILYTRNYINLDNVEKLEEIPCQIGSCYGINVTKYPPLKSFKNFPFEVYGSVNIVLQNLNSLLDLHMLSLAVNITVVSCGLKEIGKIPECKTTKCVTYNFSHNYLKSLKGLEEIRSNSRVYVEDNRIQTLDGLPRWLDVLNVKNNPIKSFEGVDKIGCILFSVKDLNHAKELFETLKGVKISQMFVENDTQGEDRYKIYELFSKICDGNNICFESSSFRLSA
jgi:hypothetical protein